MEVASRRGAARRAAEEAASQAVVGWRLPSRREEPRAAAATLGHAGRERVPVADDVRRRAAAIGIAEASDRAEAHLLQVTGRVMDRRDRGTRRECRRIPARQERARRRRVVEAQQHRVGIRIGIEQLRPAGKLHIVRVDAPRSATGAIVEPVRGERVRGGLGADAMVGPVEVGREAPADGVEQRARAQECPAPGSVRERHLRDRVAHGDERGVRRRAADEVDLARLRGLGDALHCRIRRAREKVRDLRDRRVEVGGRDSGRNQDLDDGALAFEHRAPVGGAVAHRILRVEWPIDRVRLRGCGEANLDGRIHARDREANAQRARPGRGHHPARPQAAIGRNPAQPRAPCEDAGVDRPADADLQPLEESLAVVRLGRLDQLRVDGIEAQRRRRRARAQAQRFDDEGFRRRGHGRRRVPLGCGRPRKKCREHRGCDADQSLSHIPFRWESRPKGG